MFLDWRQCSHFATTSFHCLPGLFHGTESAQHSALTLSVGGQPEGLVLLVEMSGHFRGDGEQGIATRKCTFQFFPPQARHMLLVVVVQHKGSSLELAKAGLAGLVIDLLTLLDLFSLFDLLELLVLQVHCSVEDPNTDVRHAVISAGIVNYCGESNNCGASFVARWRGSSRRIFYQLIVFSADYLSYFSCVH